MTINGLELVYVEWCDAYDYTSGWMDIDDLDGWLEDDWIIRQVGWVYEDTEDCLVLLNMISDTQISHITRVPKTWIKWRESIDLKRMEAKR